MLYEVITQPALDKLQQGFGLHRFGHIVLSFTLQHIPVGIAAGRDAVCYGGEQDDRDLRCSRVALQFITGLMPSYNFV